MRSTIKTKAVEVSFLKKTKWTGTNTRMLTFPVSELVDRCMNAWLDVSDESFARATLPTKQLSDQFSALTESDAGQTAWDGFYEVLHDEFSRLLADELAALFIELNDPATITTVLWSDGENEFLDSGCEYRY